MKLALTKYFPAYSPEGEYEKWALEKWGTCVQRGGKETLQHPEASLGLSWVQRTVVALAQALECRERAQHSLEDRGTLALNFFWLQLDVFCFKIFILEMLESISPTFLFLCTQTVTQSSSQHHLIRTVTVTRQPCCITGTDIPSCCFLLSGFALRNSSQRWAQGSMASLFSRRLCPRSHFWLKLLSVFHPFQNLSIQTLSFMSLDSLFCFPKKKNSPENDCFISSVTQIRREIFFFNTFPLSCFLPLSSCLLLLTQAYFLIKRGRSYWKAA